MCWSRRFEPKMSSFTYFFQYFQRLIYSCYMVNIIITPGTCPPLSPGQSHTVEWSAGQYYTCTSPIVKLIPLISWYSHSLVARLRLWCTHDRKIGPVGTWHSLISFTITHTHPRIYTLSIHTRASVVYTTIFPPLYTLLLWKSYRLIGRCYISVSESEVCMTPGSDLKSPSRFSIHIFMR